MQTYPITIETLDDAGAVELSQDIDALEPEVVIIEDLGVARDIVAKLVHVFGRDILP